MTISVPDDVAETIRMVAADEDMTVSAWLTQAACRYATDREAILDGLAATREFEAEYGPISNEVKARVRQEMIDYGILRPDEQPDA